MVIRQLAREARPNQRLQRTSAAQTSFAPRTPLIRGAVKATGLRTALRRAISAPNVRTLAGSCRWPKAALCPRNCVLEALQLDFGNLLACGQVSNRDYNQ